MTIEIGEIITLTATGVLAWVLAGVVCIVALVAVLLILNKLMDWLWF